ncbi:MAG TPA: DNA-processing protein DprA [Vicinamibacterales bacterium]|nr:DNA-processing protein DprA [Vicinamibacterales bacterium]
MLSLLDTVALALWSTITTRPLAGLLHALLDAGRTGPDPALPGSLAGVLACAGAAAPDTIVGTLRDQAAAALARASAQGIDVVPWSDPRYPPLLAAIPDPPVVIWIKGDAASLVAPAVAIVGSRAASPYGLEAASRLACELAEAGCAIVSGLARGVDSAAHRGALDGGGVTVGVLGSGLDVIYPPEHRGLAARMIGRGALVSEYPPGTPPLKPYFPARNRVISGLSLGVVVIEAAHRSGSLITANRALEQGRHVMAVPGNILSGRHRGSHALLRDGALVVDGADDVLAELGASSLRAVATRRSPSPDHDEVLRVMSAGESYDVDTLARETGLRPALLLPRLLDLELRGSIRRLAGGRFMRAARTC